MKLLLDSHTFIWSYDEKHKISPIALAEMSKLSNQLYLSLASVWEIQSKILNGKFKFDRPFAEIITEQQELNGLSLLPIDLSHIIELENLAPHHRDPFDRLLISQAIVEGMTLVSSDAHFKDYDVSLLW